MKEIWSKDFEEKTGMTLETNEGLAILNLGKELNVVDFSYIWSVISREKEKSSEGQLLFNPDQLLINFTNVEYIDVLSNEFTQLNELYKKIKGKGIIFCGLQEKIENVLKLISGEEYKELIIFETKEQATDYYFNQKRQEH